MSIDRADWHYETADEIYRERFGINEAEPLTDEQEREVWLYAANHIGLFMRWIADNDFYGEESDENGIEKLKNGEMTGAEYILDCCDGKLWDCDIRADILPFVKKYYEEPEENSINYFDDYGRLIPQDEPPYYRISGDEDYDKIKNLINEAYKNFKTH